MLTTSSQCVSERNNTVALTTIDGKMRAILTGRGGAWCLLYQISRDEAAGKTDSDLEKLVDCSWYITNTVEEAMQVWNDQSYVDSSGKEVIRKAPKDQTKQLGVTNRPIVQEDLNFVSPLHVYLRSWDFVMKLIVRLRVPYFNWGDSQTSRMNGFIKKEKQFVIDTIREKNWHESRCA